MPTNVHSDHIDPTVPQLIADLNPGLTIKTPICLATSTTVDRGAVLGNLLVALTGVCRS